MYSYKELVAVFFAVVGLAVVLGLIFSLPIMWLWNGCLVPAVTWANEVTWLQAWGISILCGFLFKSTSYKK